MHLPRGICKFVDNLLLFSGLIVLFLAVLCTELFTVMGVGAMGMILIALSYGFVALFWRCPHCKKRLPWHENGEQVTVCPHCSQKLK